MKHSSKRKAQKLRKLIKRSPLSLHKIAALCPMKHEDGTPVIKTGTLSSFMKGYVPKDNVILYAMGLYAPKPKRIYNKSSAELLWCLENRQEMK